jgi:hypothetical protein
LTIASLLPFIFEQKGKVQNAPQDYLDEFKFAHEHFSRNFKLKEGETPVWMIRTGKVAPLNSEARTTRRDLDSYLIA